MVGPGQLTWLSFWGHCRGALNCFGRSKRARIRPSDLTPLKVGGRMSGLSSCWVTRWRRMWNTCSWETLNHEEEGGSLAQVGDVYA